MRTVGNYTFVYDSYKLYVRITNKMHTFSHKFISIKLSCTCYEQIIVHHQEVITLHTAYSILQCFYQLIDAW